MAVIPRDAVQMPPPAASPGLPPVDPVKAPHPPRSGIGLGGPTRSERASDVFEQVTDSRPTAGPGAPRDDFFELADAGEDMVPDPSGSVAGLAAHQPVPANDAILPGTVCHPLAEPAGRDPGLVGIGVVDDGEGALPILGGSPIQSTQTIDPARESVAPVKLGALDSLVADVSSCAMVGVRRRVPARIAARPDPMQWGDDELLTLPEAAVLFWPDGPITTNTLRTAGRDGALAITKVAGKFFTTPMAIRRMGIDGVGKKSKQPEPDDRSDASTLKMKIAEAQRLGGGRARSRRAARRAVATAATGGSGQ